MVTGPEHVVWVHRAAPKPGSQFGSCLPQCSCRVQARQDLLHSTMVAGAGSDEPGTAMPLHWWRVVEQRQTEVTELPTVSLCWRAGCSR